MSQNFIASLRLFLLLVVPTLGLSHAASATIHYVSTTGTGNGSSWATASNNLQGTIASAALGDQVWVKAGTYVGNFTATDGVAVYGGFAGTETMLSQRNIDAHPSVLNANGSGNNSGVGYHLIGSLTHTNTLDGLTVENAIGSGLSDVTGDTLVVSNCTFVNNTTASRGGGLYTSSSTATISSCVFLGNSAPGNPGAGGGICAASTSTTISNCTFTSNSAYSGGGALVINTAIITGCTFADNSAAEGGGLSCEGTTATVVDCAFANNSAIHSGGGMRADSPSTTINRCSFTGNTADIPGYGNGGGIYGIASTPIVMDCTFGGTDTSAANRPQAIEFDGPGTISAPAVVKDCLIMGSGVSDADGFDLNYDGNNRTSYVTLSNNTIVNANVGINLVTGNGDVSVANNILDGNAGGLNDNTSMTFVSSHNDLFDNVNFGYQGVIPSGSDRSVNPIFVSAVGGDYHLTPGSALVDAGDDTYVTAGDFDLSGLARIQGAHVDIGAYEGAHSIGWTAVAVSAASGGNSRILWTRSDGAAGLWVMGANDTKTTVGPTYGPYAGWTAKAIATANDGTSRVLWTNANGQTGLWSFSASGVATTIGTAYGPYSGWTAKSIGVATDGTSRVLWANTNSDAGVWSFSASDVATIMGSAYGPYPGWSAKSIGVAVNGTSHVLWTNTNGQVGVWSFDTACVATIMGAAYGPYPGWSAKALGVAGDGTSRVLWTNTNGMAGLWSFNASDVETVIGTAYGPYSGYGAVALGTASDGTSRVLWDRSDRAAGIWTFGANDAQSVIGSVYGPY